jgi:hypothetical protein
MACKLSFYVIIIVAYLRWGVKPTAAYPPKTGTAAGAAHVEIVTDPCRSSLAAPGPSATDWAAALSKASYQEESPA